MYISREPVWVLVDGELRNVSEFADMDYRDRPDATCPKCNSKVIFKLGKVRRHHYAHIEDVECKFISEPESVLHFNTKMYFQEVFKSAPILFVETNCIECNSQISHEFFRDWDSIEVEYRISLDDSFIVADVAFLKFNNPIGILEVFVTHRVDEYKWHFLRKLKIPCIEFQTSDFFIKNSSQWQPFMPLPYLKLYPDLENQRCEICRIKHENKLAKKAKLAREARERHAKQIQAAKDARKKRLEIAKNRRKRNPKHETQRQRLESIEAKNKIGTISSLKIVDFFSKSGDWTRHYFMMNRLHKNKVWYKAQIINQANEVVVEITASEIQDFHRRQINHQLDRHITDLANKTDSIFDVVMNWQTIQNLKKPTFAQQYDIDYQPNFVWDNDSSKWVENPYIG